MELGGGVDANISQHFAIRLAQVDYLFTTFQDGFTNHEHNLRITTGLVFRFGGHYSSLVSHSGLHSECRT
jgi:hypothetical protein